MLALGNCPGSKLLGLGGDGPADGTLHLRLQVTPDLACDPLVLCNLTNTRYKPPCSVLLVGRGGGGAGGARSMSA